MLYDGSLHWIAISTYNCKEGELFLMNNMFRGRVAHQTKRQICSILNSDKKELKLVASLVQQQSNAIDFCICADIYSLHFIRKENTL